MHSRSGASTSPESSAPQRRHPWTFTHGFYAAMGGFVIDTSPTPIWGAHTRFTLTPEGLVWVMEHAPDLIPDISEKSILDRSKADSVAKALLVWQVFYFMVSCASRHAQSLPLSLFEVSTLAHALCTIVTYIVWWRKPLNVGEPTLIQGEKAQEIAALLLMYSTPQAYYLAGLFNPSTDAEFNYLTFRKNSSDDAITPLEERKHRSLLIAANEPVHIGMHTFTPNSKEPDALHTLVIPRAEMPWFSKPLSDGTKSVLEHSDVARWTLASRAMEHLSTDDLVEAKMPVFIAPDLGLQSTEFMSDGTFDIEVYGLFAGMAIMTLYGLPHLLGWNAHFSRELERKLWHISTVALTSVGVAICSSVLILGKLADIHFSKFWFKTCMVGITATTMYVPLTIVYPLASGYLLGESIRQLFVLPADAFRLPDLSIYLPSFS